MAVKTPLELFVLLALAAAVAWIFRTGLNYSPNKQIGSNSPAQPSKLYEVTPLLVLLSVYWAFALTSNMNIGHRHVLPTYPPLFIVAGAAGLWFPVARTDQRKWVGAIHWVIVVALILSAAEALWFWPNYLAYFNIFVGGPRYGYKHLVDSSLDWSQDAKELKRWFDNHPADVLPPQRVYLSFFGDTPLEYFGIEATKLPSFLSPWQPHVEESLHGGTYCISATELQNVFLEPCPGRWNKRYEEAYQLLRHNVELYRRSQSDPALQEQSKQFATPEEWNKMFDLYERLRFSRLCSFLRQREPDDEVGYSILIYRLSDADVSRALDGPPVELLEKPETKDK